MKALKFFAVCFFSLCLVSAAKAQDLGAGAGLWNIVEQNAAFDAYAYQQAAAISQQFLTDRTNYRLQTGDWSYIPGPVSPMQLHQSINELNDVYYANNQAWHDQSNRIHQAIGRWSEAFRGD